MDTHLISHPRIGFRGCGRSGSGLIVKNNKVFCQSAKRVVVKYECEGNKDKYCNDVEVGCFLIKEKLAMRLKIAHQSLLQNKVLNCHFDIHSSKLEL